MKRKETEWAYKGIFTVFMVILLIGSTILFYGNINSDENVFDGLKAHALDWQQKTSGYIKLYYDTGYIPAEIGLTGYMVEGFTVEQKLEITEEMLTYDSLAIAVEMATYNRKNNSTLYVEFIQEDNYNKMYKVDASRLKDNSDLEVIFPTEGLLEGTLTVRFFGDAENEENAVTMYTTTSIGFSDTMNIGGKEEKRNLIMVLYTPYGAEETETEAEGEAP